MERKINHLSICYTLFLILLFLSGSLEGVWSEAVYFLAFLVPMAFGLWTVKDDENDKSYLGVRGEDLKFFIPLAAPTVYLVMILSVVTSLLLKLTLGVENNVDLGDSLVIALLYHALLPAILEEALFRYLPMRMLAGHSKRVTVLLSATLFALVHHSLFSIPYAFLAGMIFMLIDLACDSVIPSVILHFINNALSVSMLVYKDNPTFSLVALVILRILALASVIYLVINRKEYLKRFSLAFSKGEKFRLNLPVVLFGAVCILVAVISII